MNFSSINYLPSVAKWVRLSKLPLYIICFFIWILTSCMNMIIRLPWRIDFPVTTGTLRSLFRRTYGSSLYTSLQLKYKTTQKEQAKLLSKVEMRQRKRKMNDEQTSPNIQVRTWCTHASHLKLLFSDPRHNWSMSLSTFSSFLKFDKTIIPFALVGYGIDYTQLLEIGSLNNASQEFSLA